MARDTSLTLKNQCIYSVYVRNHTSSGDFKGVTRDLDRIKDLGVDIIWFLPIHPIGEVNKKGSLGCPYSIEDYRKVNPEYGTLEDFKELIDEAHKRNLKVMIDVVYNHTSHESALYKEHPEWFYKKANGCTGNKVGDWTDIIDLDYNNKGLWDYQIETLKYWASIGVDGFRCDVAPLVPIDFWIRARKEVAEVKEGVLWLAETADPGFMHYLRSQDVLAHSDCEMYEAFDMTYDYDTFKYVVQYLEGQKNLEYVLEKKRLQEYVYPRNYVKMRYVENHDNLRAAFIIPEENDLKNWTAFTFFENGIPLIYAGQEVRDDNTPSLFDRDPVLWNDDKEFTSFIKTLISIKKNEIFAYGYYEILEAKKQGVIEARYTYGDKKLIGIFNVERKIGEYEIDLKDGGYENLIDGIEIEVIDGKFRLPVSPIIIEV